MIRPITGFAFLIPAVQVPKQNPAPQQDPAPAQDPKPQEPKPAPAAAPAPQDPPRLADPFAVEPAVVAPDVVDEVRAQLNFRLAPGFGIDLGQGDLNMTIRTGELRGDNALTLNKKAFQPTDPLALKTTDWTVVLADKGTPITIRGFAIRNSKVVGLQAIEVGEGKTLDFLTAKVEKGDETLFVNDYSAATNQPVMHIKQIVFNPPNERGEMRADPQQTQVDFTIDTNLFRYQFGRNSWLGKFGPPPTRYEYPFNELLKRGVDLASLTFGMLNEKIPGVIDDGRLVLTNLDLAPLLSNRVPQAPGGPHDLNWFLTIPDEVRARLGKNVFRPLGPEALANPVLGLKELLSRLIESGEIDARFGRIDLDMVDPALGVTLVGQVQVDSKVRLASASPADLKKVLPTIGWRFPDLAAIPYSHTYPRFGQKTPQIKIPRLVLITDAAKAAGQPALNLDVEKVEMGAHIFAVTSNAPELDPTSPSAVLRDVHFKTGRLTATEPVSGFSFEMPEGLELTAERVMAGHGLGIYMDYIANPEGPQVPAELLPDAKGHVDLRAQNAVVKIPAIRFHLKTANGQVLQGEIKGLQYRPGLTELRGHDDFCGEALVQDLLNNTVQEIPWEKILKVIEGIRIDQHEASLSGGTVRYTDANVDLLVNLEPAGIAISSQGLDMQVGRLPGREQIAGAKVQLALGSGTYQGKVRVEDLGATVRTDMENGTVQVSDGRLKLSGSGEKVGDASSRIDLGLAVEQLSAGIHEEDGKISLASNLGVNIRASAKGEKYNGNLTAQILPSPEKDFAVSYDTKTGTISATGHAPTISAEGNAQLDDQRVAFKGRMQPLLQDITITGLQNIIDNGEGVLTFQGGVQVPGAAEVEVVANGQPVKIQIDANLGAAIADGRLTLKRDAKGYVTLETASGRDASGQISAAAKKILGIDLQVKAIKLGGNLKAFTFLPGDKPGEGQWHQVELPPTWVDLKDIVADTNGLKVNGKIDNSGLTYYFRQGQTTDGSADLAKLDRSKPYIDGQASLTPVKIGINPDGSLKLPDELTAALRAEGRADDGTTFDGSLTVNTKAAPEKDFHINYDTVSGKVQATGHAPIITADGKVRIGENSAAIHSRIQPVLKDMVITGLNDVLQNGKGVIGFDGSVNVGTLTEVQIVADGITIPIKIDADLGAAIQQGRVTVKEGGNGYFNLTTTEGTDLNAQITQAAKNVFGIDVSIKSIKLSAGVSASTYVGGPNGDGQWHQLELPPSFVELKNLTADSQGLKYQQELSSQGLAYYLLHGRTTDGSADAAKIDQTKPFDVVQFKLAGVSVDQMAVDPKARGGSVRIKTELKGMETKLRHGGDVWGNADVTDRIDSIVTDIDLQGLEEFLKGNLDKLKGGVELVVSSKSDPKRAYSLFAKIGGFEPLTLNAMLDHAEVKIEFNPADMPDSFVVMSVKNDPIAHAVRVGQPGDEEIYHNLLPGFDLTNKITIDREGIVHIDLGPKEILRSVNAVATGDGISSPLFEQSKSPMLDVTIPRVLVDTFARKKFGKDVFELLTDEQKAKLPKDCDDVPYADFHTLIGAGTTGRLKVDFNSVPTLNALAAACYGPGYVAKCLGRPGAFQELSAEQKAGFPRYYGLSAEQQKALVTLAGSCGYEYGGDKGKNRNALATVLTGNGKYDGLSDVQKGIVRAVESLVKASVSTDHDNHFVESGFKADIQPVIHGFPLSYSEAEIHIRFDPKTGSLKGTRIKLHMVVYTGPDPTVYHTGASKDGYLPDLCSEVKIRVGEDEKGNPSDEGGMWVRFGRLRERLQGEYLEGRNVDGPMGKQWLVDWNGRFNSFKTYDPLPPTGPDMQKETEAGDGLATRLLYGVSMVDEIGVYLKAGQPPYAYSMGRNQDGLIRLFDIPGALSFGLLPQYTLHKDAWKWSSIPMFDEFARELGVASDGLILSFGRTLAALGADHNIGEAREDLKGNVNATLEFEDPESKKKVEFSVFEGLVYDSAGEKIGTMDENYWANFAWNGKPWTWHFKSDGEMDWAKMRALPAEPKKK